MARQPPLLLLLLLVDSLHFVFARLLRPFLPSGTAALYVLAVGTLEVGVYLWITRQISWQLLRQKWWFFLTIGFLVAFSTSMNYLAVAYIDPGTAALLGQTTVIFALLFGLYWLREKLSVFEILGALVAIIGTFIISFQPGDFGQFGSLLVLLGASMYALHAAVVKRYGGEMDFANFFFFRLLMTTMFLSLFAVGRGQFTWVNDGRVWPLLLLVGSVDVVISRLLYYLALRRLNLTIHAILLTLSPVITIGWSLILFDERPSWQGLLGGVAVIVGVVIVTVVRNRKQRSLSPFRTG